MAQRTARARRIPRTWSRLAAAAAAIVVVGVVGTAACSDPAATELRVDVDSDIPPGDLRRVHVAVREDLASSGTPTIVDTEIDLGAGGRTLPGEVRVALRDAAMVRALRVEVTAVPAAGDGYTFVRVVHVPPRAITTVDVLLSRRCMPDTAQDQPQCAVDQTCTATGCVPIADDAPPPDAGDADGDSGSDASDVPAVDRGPLVDDAPNGR